jgi:hypothetical protein
MVLCYAWRVCSWRIAQLAGSREVVVRMIQTADWDAFQLPLVRASGGCRADLPERFTVYRGGVGPAEELARGLCWTDDVRLAGAYARRRVEQTRPPAKPLVVKRVVQREAVLWTWRSDDTEFLIAAPGPWRLVTDDPKRIDSLFRAGLAVARAHHQAQAAALAKPAHGGDVWGGWTGEESP